MGIYVLMNQNQLFNISSFPPKFLKFLGLNQDPHPFPGFSADIQPYNSCHDAKRAPTIKIGQENLV
jgi:hypothetical protein